MGRIFLSHSSKNNAEAVALRDVLVAAGFDDLFLDLDPDRGITGGQVWERALATAANRCEAVIILASREWLASDWCRREAHCADKLNKRIFAVLIDDLPRAELPAALTSKWQVVDLARGNDSKMFSPVRPDGTLERTVLFSESGLRRLINGLTAAGLDPRTFAWPPANDPNRSPYPGLRPLASEDAGIFFGREAPTIAILDRLRGLREAAPPRFLIVLGASGAGKSSFLRAGVLPRLARDDRNFIVLPIVRPSRAALFGETGLLPALETALKPLNVARAEIRTAIEAGAPGIRRLLSALVEARRVAPMPGEPHLPPPAVVLTIDQGEELFSADGRQEGAALLAILRDLLLQPGGDGTAAETPAPEVIAIASIRSDAYEALQTAPALSGIRQETMSLAPLPRGSYQEVIEGPARRVRAAGRELTIEPALTEALLVDIGAGDAKDALPLLAFTLEWIFREYHPHGVLRLADYRTLRGIRGAIDAAVAQAMKEADADPAVPRNPADRQALLRRALVPWLAMVDPDTHTPRRRVARLSEIPADAQPLIAPLIAARLLSTDLGSQDGKQTIELAHEALLRQWSLLEGWIIQDAALLATAEDVRRAASDWEENDRRSDWLVHAGGRLVEAERVARRPDLTSYVGPEGRAYLFASRTLEDERAAKEAARRKLERIGLVGAICLAAIAIVGGGVAFHFASEAETQAANAVRNETTSLSALARAALANDRPADAVALAIAAWPRPGEERPQLRRTLESLGAALPLHHERVRLRGHNWLISMAAFSPDGTRVLTGSHDRTARVWEATTGAELAVWPRDASNMFNDIADLAFSPDGMRVAIGSLDGAATIWDIATRKTLDVLPGDNSTPLNPVFSPDGTRVVTGSRGGSASVWDLASRTELAVLPSDGDVMIAAALSPDGTRVVTVSQSGSARIWNAATGAATVPEFAVQPGNEAPIYGEDIVTAAFSPDGTQVLTALSRGVPRIWDAATGAELAVLPCNRPIVAAFSPSGTRVVTVSDDGTNTARIWDAASATEIAVLRGHEQGISDAAFSPDGGWVLTGSYDGTARIWDAANGAELSVLAGHETATMVAAFSPDGTRVVTGSADGTARIWDTPTKSGAALPLLKAKDYLLIVAFSPDGTRVITSSEYSGARVWDVATWTELAVLHDESSLFEGSIGAAAFSTDGTRVVTDSIDGTARIWDAATGVRLFILPSQEENKIIVDMAFSHNGTRVVTGTQDGTVRLWDAATGAPLTVLPGEESDFREGFFDVAISPDGTQIVKAFTAGTVRVFDVATGTKLADFPIGTKLADFPDEIITTITFSPDMTRYVTGSPNGTARIWDATSGQQLSVMHVHRGYIFDAAFSPDGTRVVTGSSDDTARIWDTDTGAELAVLPADRLFAAAFSADGARIVTISRDGAVRIWTPPGVQSGNALEIACNRLGNTVDSTALSAQYGISNMAPICGDHRPLPIDRARLE